MLLIQRLTSILLCFVLFILEGINAADIEECQNAVIELFRAASSRLDNLKFDESGVPLLDYYFIPGYSDITDLASFYKNPAEPYLNTNVVIKSPVYFETEESGFQSVRFTTFGRYNFRFKDASLTFVCKGSSCRNSLSTLKKYMAESDELICLPRWDIETGNYIRLTHDEKIKPADIENFIKLTDDNKIKATVFGKSFNMFDADKILLDLIRKQSTKQIPSFTATTALLTEDDKTVIFGDKSGKVVAQVPLPKQISSEVLQYIYTAIHLVNQDHIKLIFLDEEPSNHLQPIKQRGYFSKVSSAILNSPRKVTDYMWDGITGLIKK